MTEVAIETDGLTKHYGNRVAVDGLNLRVPAGSVSGLVGPNGAGKTTTIRMLLGLLSPTAGRALVLGEPLDGRLRFLERVGALVDGPAFYPRLSGRNNLRVLERLSTRRGDVDAALAATGMTDRADDLVVSYSLGMRQRLALSAALLTTPELVILDEPANGLDPAGIVEMRQLIRELAHSGTTVLISSHQLSELEQVCDHIVLLRDGQTRYQGSLEQLLARQQARVTAAPEQRSDLDALAHLARQCGWHATVDDQAVVFTAPEGAAATLNRVAHERGITLAELRRRPPTLEETFFALTDAAGTEGS
jgi:ABC-2 type transport system ATP-binding protein